MDLTRSLKKVGYDLIDSPIRNHKLMQLWLKKDWDRVQLYYDQLVYAFKSSVELNTFTNNALKVTSTTKNEFHFNIGITVLDDVLKSIGLANVSFASALKSGKSVSISYDNSISKEIEIGSMEAFFSAFDFQHPNPLLLKNLNKNDVLLVTGVLYAKNLIVEIKTDATLSAELKASLTQAGEGKIDFDFATDKTLKLTTETGDHYPIAVKASRLDFDHGRFKDHALLTDHRNLF